MKDSSEAFSTAEGYQIAVLESLAAAHVDFLVFGSYAMRVHGAIRTADDLDVLISREPENLERLRKALVSFSSISADSLVACLLAPSCKFAYSKVEFFGVLKGLEAETLFSEAIAVQVTLQGGEAIRVLVMSLECLIASKELAASDPDRAARRHSDLEDLKVLQALRPAV